MLSFTVEGSGTPAPWEVENHNESELVGNAGSENPGKENAQAAT
jgi:hypothetical protein